MVSQSPKFPARKIELANVVTVSKIKNCWKKKVRTSLRKSILVDPYEWLDFHNRIDQIAKEIESSVLDGTYRTASPERIRLEKSKGLCRQITIPRPEDAIVLQLFSDALYLRIKEQQPSNKAFFAPEDHSFSQKKDENGISGYGSFAAWMNFQESVFGFSKTYNFMVITDIANYYDFINHAHLRNIISGFIKVKESILDVLIYSLSGLLWEPDYMPRMSVGLPQMNEDAPRILAHCFLYELDRFLSNQQNCDFTRYMDDIDIGVNTIQHAKRLLRDIDLILQTRQVRLNSGKTKILTSAEAKIHFRLKENRILDRLTDVITNKIANNIPCAREQNHLSLYLEKGLQKQFFSTGNGGKILKRVLTIGTKCGADFPDEQIISIVKLRPSVRQNALRYRDSKILTIQYVQDLKQLIVSENFVDHAAPLMITNHLVRAMAKNDVSLVEAVKQIADQICEIDAIGFTAALSLYQKYAPSNELNGFIKNNFSVWQIDKTAGRFVGAAYPYLLKTNEFENFKKTIYASKNLDAIASFEFSDSLTKDINVLTKLYSFIAAPNKSLPLNITPPKFGMLLSSLTNTKLSEKKRVKLIENHSKIEKDDFLNAHLNRILEK